MDVRALSWKTMTLNSMATHTHTHNHSIYNRIIPFSLIKIKWKLREKEPLNETLYIMNNRTNWFLAYSTLNKLVFFFLQLLRKKNVCYFLYWRNIAFSSIPHISHNISNSAENIFIILMGFIDIYRIQRNSAHLMQFRGILFSA